MPKPPDINNWGGRYFGAEYSPSDAFVSINGTKIEVQDIHYHRNDGPAVEAIYTYNGRFKFQKEWHVDYKFVRTKWWFIDPI